MRPDVEVVTHKLTTKKLADRYIGRRGEPPSLTSRRAAARSQDLNDDDRKHLKWCLGTLSGAIVGKGTTGKARAALEFVTALIERDYDINRGVSRPEDQDPFVDERKDQELYAHMINKRISK